MSIEYVEIRAKNTREVIGIVDTTTSIIWRSLYYGVGDFEIYAPATQQHIALLIEGNYVSRPYDMEIGIIEAVEIINSKTDGSMIIASGRLAKSILDRRHIYKLSGKTNTPTILRGNVESAVRAVVVNNAISCTFDSRRNISFLELGANAGLPDIIVDDQGNAAQKQVSYKNLLEYTDSVLQEYQMSARVRLNDNSKKLQYTVFRGVDRSMTNTDGNDPVIFSAEFDNLFESNYKLDTALKKNTALIGGEGEGLDRFYSLLAGSETGFERRETFIDAASISRTYKEEGDDEEKTYTDAEYKALLDAQGKQTLATLITEEAFDGQLNISGGIWRFGEDFGLGDIVTIQDNQLGLYINVRIVEVIETEDESGYSVSITYQSERND